MQVTTYEDLVANDHPKSFCTQTRRIGRRHGVKCKGELIPSQRNPDWVCCSECGKRYDTEAAPEYAARHLNY